MVDGYNRCIQEENGGVVVIRVSDEDNKELQNYLKVGYVFPSKYSFSPQFVNIKKEGTVEVYSENE